MQELKASSRLLVTLDPLVWIEIYWMKVNEFQPLINLTFESKINL